MEPTQDFKSLQDTIQASLVKAVKSVNRITAEDLAFQRTVNPEVADLLDDKSTRFLDLSTRLLKSAANACGLKAPTLDDVEDIDMNWRQVVDIVDTLLEKADTALDEYTGLIKRKEPPTADTAPNAKRSKSTAKVIRNANISKPQLQFDRKPDNFPTTPWKPILVEKPHASLSLKNSLVTFTSENGTPQFKHPYETEINSMQYPNHIFQKAEPIPYTPIDDTNATFVDTYEGVLEMLEHLKKAKEIAVDLEHHDFRTYTGLVSLMQISTRDQDWIVDTLKPWRQQLQVLNQVFTDPNIIKVFHGAYMDMVWLQRDLGLYVNSLFDTYFACELLSYQARSLAFLLSKFVNFDADKQYQLADWRMRPLPEEMMYYARSDTHYLLYIFDKVRNDLLTASDPSKPETDLMRRALTKSKDVALSRYEHPSYNEKTGEGSRGWYNFLLKHSHLGLDKEQFAVFRALWTWRDATARKEDENPNFVIGSNQILDISRQNPPDIKALHSLLPSAASLAKPRLNEIWDEMKQAKAEDGPSLLHFLSSHASESWKNNGVSRIAKLESPMPQIADDVVVIRMKKSHLFGDMPISSRWEEKKESSKDDKIIPFPWQRYMEQKAPEAVKAEAESQQPEPTPVPVEQPIQDADQEFTLKRGKKRKASPVEEASDSESSSDGSSSEDDDEDEQMKDDEPVDLTAGGILTLDDKPNKLPKRSSTRSKVSHEAYEIESKKTKVKERTKRNAERKKEKKQEKLDQKKQKAERKERKAEKKQKKEEANPPAENFNAVPFDYSKAASVMNAGRNGPREQGKRKEAFDPYAKTADDGLKGARRAPPIKGERSGTFRK